jgi:hypothetical protein
MFENFLRLFLEDSHECRGRNIFETSRQHSISLNDTDATTLHLAPPTNDGSDFNTQQKEEIDRNSVSRQSLMGMFG